MLLMFGTKAAGFGTTLEFGYIPLQGLLFRFYILPAGLIPDSIRTKKGFGKSMQRTKFFKKHFVLFTDDAGRNLGQALWAKGQGVGVEFSHADLPYKPPKELF